MERGYVQVACGPFVNRDGTTSGRNEAKMSLAFCPVLGENTEQI